MAAKKQAAPTITLTYNREEKKFAIKIEDFDGVPATALDRIDILIEKELFWHRRAERLAAAEASRKEMISQGE